MKPVMNLDEVAFDDVEENGIYTSSRATISDHIGARNLGYNLTVLPPGKVQCPFHDVLVDPGHRDLAHRDLGAGRPVRLGVDDPGGVQDHQPVLLELDP